MEFSAGLVVGVLLSFLWFSLSLRYLEGRQYRVAKQEIMSKPLPVVLNNDEREAQIEQIAFRKAEIPDFPEGLGRV